MVLQSLNVYIYIYIHEVISCFLLLFLIKKNYLFIKVANDRNRSQEVLNPLDLTHSHDLQTKGSQ